MPRQGKGEGGVMFTQRGRRFDLWLELMGRTPIH